MARPRKVPPQPQPNVESVPATPAEVVPPPQVKGRLLLKQSPPVPPASAEDILHNVTCRQLNDDANSEVPEGAVETDPVLSGMRSVVDALRTGGTMIALKPVIDRFARANDQVAQVIGTMYVRHQYERLVSNLEAQSVLEKFLHRCLKRGDLDSKEALVFLGMVRSEIRAITASVTKQAREGIPDVDGNAAVEKMDHTVQTQQQEASEMFKDTTAHGREMMRKLLAMRRKKIGL